MSKVERKQLLSREERLKLHPVEAYFDEEYKNETEKKEIIKKIINQIKTIKEAENTLKCHNNKLGSFISKHCENCSYHYWENGAKQAENGKTNDILSKQLEDSIPISSNSDNTIIAYEPVWAIGTGLTRL